MMGAKKEEKKKL